MPFAASSLRLCLNQFSTLSMLKLYFFEISTYCYLVGYLYYLRLIQNIKISYCFINLFKFIDNIIGKLSIWSLNLRRLNKIKVYFFRFLFNKIRKLIYICIF